MSSDYKVIIVFIINDNLCLKLSFIIINSLEFEFTLLGKADNFRKYESYLYLLSCKLLCPLPIFFSWIIHFF